MKNLGVIKSIREVTISYKDNSKDGFIKVLKQVSDSDYVGYSGYEIVTDLHTYHIMISAEQICCEDWGYFSSDDNINDYIGKSLVDVSLTDTALNVHKLKEADLIKIDEGEIQFVDFKFSDGSVLQFAVYNASNGWYGHNIIVAQDQDILCQDLI